MEEIQKILENSLMELEKASSISDVVAVKNLYLSKKGKLSVLMNKMRDLSIEERKTFGKELNDAKITLESRINEKLEKLNKEKLLEELNNETIDITLPGNSLNSGEKNPFYKIIDEIEEIFIGMGYTVEKGSEVDKDHYVFELLNIPKDHPARDMQDTLYIDNETLLRSHTSAVQAHVMEKANGKPIKIICPGKTYRRDDDDMTHSHQFAQVEGLVVGENITIWVI